MNPNRMAINYTKMVLDKMGGLVDSVEEYGYYIGNLKVSMNDYYARLGLEEYANKKADYSNRLHTKYRNGTIALIGSCLCTSVSLVGIFLGGMYPVNTIISVGLTGIGAGLAVYGYVQTLSSMIMFMKGPERISDLIVATKSNEINSEILKSLE
jgi:hypothetical protein